MAVFNGKTAFMYFSAALFKSLTWTLNIVADAIEVTAMTDTWQTFLAGLDDFTGTATGLAETTVDYAALIGTEAAIRFHVDDTQYFGAANAIITSIAESVDIEGRGEITYGFEGDDVTGIDFT